MMFIEQIDVVDLILEGTKALLGCGVVFILWRSGKKYPELDEYELVEQYEKDAKQIRLTIQPL